MESFGRYLSRQRELRGLTRAEIAAITRISSRAIEALEEDRPGELPAPVFVTGYLRSIAGAIGLPVDDTLLRFQEWRAAQPVPEEPARPRRAPVGRVVLLLAALVALAAAGLWLAGRP